MKHIRRWYVSPNYEKSNYDVMEKDTHGLACLVCREVERKADALLIAAAPSLLAALDEATEMYSEPNILDIAHWKDALAKARGKLAHIGREVEP